MNTPQINKLPQEIINQIAAGEVVERPASVVKELVDNSIDAGATKIRIKIEEGGIKLIEIADNGIGIEKDNLGLIFEPHTTSKLSSIEDLNNILTMGFRGEALSTILSVSNVTISSKYQTEQFANKLEFENPDSQYTKSAREQGTTITIKNLFYNIPARRKFLKTPQTEYRKILETLIPYFITYPNIHFILQNGKKEVYNLPQTSNEQIMNIGRIKEIIKGGFVDKMIPIKAGGAGIVVSGYIGHPTDNQSRTKHQYIFVNNRSIWDNSIAKAVHQGFSRYIPHGTKVPFIINIEIQPDQIDVNVHPRKEEIKFINPFRVFSIVEGAVSEALKASFSLKEGKEISMSPTTSIPKDYKLKQSYSPKELRFNNKPSAQSVQQSLDFSKTIIQDTPNFEYQKKEQGTVSNDIRTVHQIFNKYIIVEKENDLWIIDQHAAAERITFEKLLIAYKTEGGDIQNLLVPTEIEVSEDEKVLIKENIEFFSKVGFDIEIVEDRVRIKSVPIELVKADFEKLFKEVYELIEQQSEASHSLDTIKSDVLATVACHQSIRTGQKLQYEEMLSLFNQLTKCDNPYSCPHGRPVIWKQTLSELDSNFDRTY